MKTVKHEMFSVEMTNQELEEMVVKHIKAKYPFLNDEDTWSWEDFSINFDYKEHDKVGVFSMWTKNEKVESESIKPNCGEKCGGCTKVDPFNTVCR